MADKKDTNISCRIDARRAALLEGWSSKNRWTRSSVAAAILQAAIDRGEEFVKAVMVGGEWRDLPSGPELAKELGRAERSAAAESPGSTPARGRRKSLGGN